MKITQYVFQAAKTAAFAFGLSFSLMTALFVISVVLNGCASAGKTRRIANPNARSTGTIFNVAYKGRTFGVTAGHVCSQSQTGYLVYPENGAIHDLKILANDLLLDVCILEPASGISTMSVAEPAKEPKAITVYGFPGFSGSEVRSTGALVGVGVSVGQVGKEDSGECPRFSVGYKDEDGEKQCSAPLIRAVTDARAYRGVSGGPVLDEAGNVCGVVTAIGARSGSPTYFAPTPLLTYVLDQLTGA